MNTGDRVVWDDEVGVVLSVEGEHITVSMPSAGVITVSADELRPHDDDAVSMLRAGKVGDARRYLLRMQSEFLRHAYRFDPLAGLSNARVEPKHHQVYVAHRATRKPLPRMILADEVGLGKTIEAGLILKELRAREVADRVIIFVPANLRTQWQQELSGKFNLDFMIMDGDAARHFGRDGSNPFEAHDRIICSLSFASRRNRREEVSALHWDLAIFDEAHRVRYSPDKPQMAYQLARSLRDTVDGFLLLTATPMQLRVDELWGLIDLVEPGLYPSVRHYEHVRRQLPALNSLMKQVKSWAALTDVQRTRFQEEAPRLLRDCGIERGELESLATSAGRERLLDRIAEHHPLADVLVRNRRADVGGFVQRKARRCLVPMTLEEEDAYEQVTNYLRDTYNLAGGGNNAVGFLMVTYHKMLASSSAAIYASLRRRRASLEEKLKDHQEAAQASWTSLHGDDRRELLEASDSTQGLDGVAAVGVAIETEIAVLGGLIRQLGKLRDSKALRLVQLVDEILDADPTEKVLIFTQFLETQKLLETAIRARGWSVEVFNGNQSPSDKDAAIERFRRRSQVLVSTEAGGEGRNLQFCHILFNYDLPWNPMKVEQRIGRVDRIGQDRPVVIFNLANEGTIEERVLDVLAERIRLFEESVGSLDPILGEVEQDIERLALLTRGEQEDQFRRLEADVERRVREALDAEETLRDFALERNSFRQDETNALLGRRAMATPAHLKAYVDEVLRFEGGVLTEEVDGRTAITLSPALERRLRRRTPVYRGTFDPQEAIREESWEFLAMGHELIDDLLVASRDDSSGLTGVRVDSTAPPGGGVEVVYEIAVGGLQHRGELFRHVIDAGMQLTARSVSAPFEWDLLDAAVEVPGWVDEALSISGSAARERLSEVKAEALAELEEVRRDKRERADRVYRYKVDQIAQATRNLENTINELEADDDEERRRILPALRARVRKNQERTDRLATEHRDETQRIDQLRPAVSLRVVGCAVLVRP